MTFSDDEVRRTAELLRSVLDEFLGGESSAGGTSLLARLTEHLGGDPIELAVVTERWAAHEHADVQLAIERWLAETGAAHTLVGTHHPARRHQSLAELLFFVRFDAHLTAAPADLVHVPVGPDRTHPCVQFGFYLVSTQPPMVLLVRGPDLQAGRDDVEVEILSFDAERAGELVATLRRLAVELSPVRGQIVTLAPPDRPGGSPIAFLRRPVLGREQLVLPEASIAAVERQVLGVADHRDQLRLAGQHLKRGLLLYGPPGTGKTHTVRYLLGRLTDTTVVVLSGTALHQVAAACGLARRHQPSVVVLEDVDLVAGDRSFGPPGSNPLLFEVLNQLDGLGDDVDVVFVLTTNRVEVLERALAERPGRVDEAVEIAPPDAAGRAQLLRLYGQAAGVADLDLTATVEATDGLTATFLRELVRRAVVTAAHDRPHERPVRVAQGDLEAAVAQLLASRATLTRALLGADRGITEPPGPYVEHGWAMAPPLHARGGPARVGGWFAYAPGGPPGASSGSVPPGWEDPPEDPPEDGPPGSGTG